MSIILGPPVGQNRVKTPERQIDPGPPRTGSLTVGVSVWFCFIFLPVSLFDLWIACCIELFHCWMKLKFGIVCRECTQFSRQTLGGLCRGYRTDLKKKNKELEKNMLIHRQNGGLQFTQIIENGRSVLKSPSHYSTPFDNSSKNGRKKVCRNNGDKKIEGKSCATFNLLQTNR